MPEQPLFGYKAHVAVDQGSGLVRRGDSHAGPCLGQSAVPGSGAGRRAPRTPTSATMAGGTVRSPRDVASRTASCAAPQGQGRLSAADRARNRAIGKIRAAVERSFATLKRWYGYRRVRYRSLVRNALRAATVLALAMNLRRALVLTA